ncbi:hypothetical protein V6N13_101529 [Hibiscus sabdariffa]
MDHTESESNRGGEMEIVHFSHQHPLVFIQDESFASEAAQCFGFIFTISIETGRSSSNMVMLFGISTTGLYLVIFVMKFLAMLKSDDIEPVNLGLSSDRTSNSGN